MQTVAFIFFGVLLLYIVALLYNVLKGLAIISGRLAHFRPTAPEPENKSPYRSGTEYVFAPMHETRVTTCDNCRHKFIVPKASNIAETCPECGHTNLPF